MSELELKIAELESLKKSYEDFIESSSLLEKELEEALEDSEAKCTDLSKKKAMAEEKYSSLHEKYVSCGNQLSNCQKELSIALEKISVSDSKKREMETMIEDLQEQVRILEATELDLTHKLERSEEDIVFLQSDIEEIKAQSIDSEKRLKAELTDIQAELARGDIPKPSEDDIQNGSDSKNDQNDQNKELIDELELEIEELNERLNQSEQQNQQLNEEVGRLADELIMIHEKHAKSSSSAPSTPLKELASNREENNTQLQNELNDVRSALDSNMLLLEVMKQEKDDLTTQMNEARHRVKQLELDCDELRTQLVSLKSSEDNLKFEILNLTKENSVMLILKNEYLVEKESFEATIIERDATIQELREQIISLEIEMEEIRLTKESEDASNELVHSDLKHAEAMGAKWKDEKEELLKEIEVLRNAVSRSLTRQSTPMKDPRKSLSLSPTKEGMLKQKGPLFDEKEEVNEKSGEDVSRQPTIELLDSGELNRREVEEAIKSNNGEKMKDLLMSKTAQLENMRKTNAKLLQKLQAARGNIQVCCRPRPPSQNELSVKQGTHICVEVVDENEIACYDKRAESWRSFVFDRVWRMNEDQADVFADVEPLVLSVLEGYNTCLFAYGQTGSGKTFTMNGYGQEYGVSYRTLSKIFEVLKLREAEAEARKLTALLIKGQNKDYNSGESQLIGENQKRTSIEHSARSNAESSARSSSRLNSRMSEVENITEEQNKADNVESDGEDEEKDEESGNGKDERKRRSSVPALHENKWDEDDAEAAFSYSVEVSMMEIYNDQVYDLLGGSGAGGEEVLDIRQAADGTVHVPGLQQVPVTCLEDVLEVFAKGSANRATSTTNLNEHSSRSHSILAVDVSSTTRGSTTRAKLFLVDLAGSERAGKSGVTGAAMKETQHINKSLAALGDVMEALDQKAKHIPYRNSKLTYLLQDSLGGNSRTMMIITVCPTELTIEESLFTLSFASRVRNISLGVARKHVNAKNLEDQVKAAKAEARELKRKRTLLEDNVAELKKQLKKITDKASSQVDIKGKMVDEIKKTTDQQIQILNKTNQDLSARLQEEKEAKQKALVDLETLQKTFKKANDQLKDVQKERERMALMMKQKEQEREKEREKEKEVSMASSLSRPATRVSSVSSVPSFGPPRREANGIPSLRSRRTTMASSSNQTSSSLSTEVTHSTTATATTTTSATSSITSSLSVEDTQDPILQSIASITETSCESADNSLVLTAAEARDIITSPIKSNIPRSNTKRTSMRRSITISDEKSEKEKGSEVVGRLNRSESVSSVASGTSKSRKETKPTEVISKETKDTNPQTSLSTSILRTGIAMRSREALLRHQERMEKIREKHAAGEKK